MKTYKARRLTGPILLLITFIFLGVPFGAPDQSFGQEGLAPPDENQRLNSTNLEHGLAESRIELNRFLQNMPKAYKKQPWYGLIDDKDNVSAKCGHSVLDEKGNVKPDRLALMEGDINNDGITEYILVARCKGSADTDSIIEVFQKKKNTYVGLNFASLLSKNGLRDKVPAYLASPFLSNQDGKIEMHFMSPKEVWLWQGTKIKKIDPPGAEKRN